MSFEQWILAAIGTAAVAGIGTWLSGLPLRRAKADPTIAERMQRHRVRLGLVAITAAAAMPFVVDAGCLASGRVMQYGAWFVPSFAALFFVAGLGAAAGGYPLRRDLFGERNSLPGYVWRGLRGALALYGFWLALLLLPYLGAPAALALALLLLIVSANHPAYVCAMLGARPFADAALAPEFERVLAATTGPRPRVLVCGNDRGSVINAFALPSNRDPRVLMTQPLLRDLEPAEIVGVFAHEVAHHEDFDAPTLRRWRIEETILIALGAVGALFLPLLLWAWPVLLFLALWRRARTMQDRERYSDRRAAELCGDTEAYIRALEKIYASNALPRRMDGDAERRSSHPSLARRIQALREGMRPERAERSVYRSRDDASALLVLGADRVHWLECDDPSDDADTLLAAASKTRSIAFDAISELRVIVRRGGARLRVVETGGAKHEFLPRADDVGRLQADLDRTDGRLAALPPKGSKADGAFFAGAVAALTATVEALRNQLPLFTALVMLVLLIALRIRRRRAVFAALGAIALGAVLHRVLLTADARWWGAGDWCAMAAIGACGVYLLAFRAPIQIGRPRLLAAVFVVLGALGLASLLSYATDLPLHLYATGNSAPTSYLLWAGAAAALLVAGSRWQRAFGAVLALTVLLGFGAGSDWFLREIVRDPFAVGAPEPKWRDVEYRRVGEARVDGFAYDLELSPGGKRFLADRLLGDFTGNTRSLVAVDAAFVDEERVLLLYPADMGSELRLVRCDAPDQVLWSHRLEGWGASADLELHTVGERWTVIEGRHAFVTRRVRGRVGQSDVRADMWEAGSYSRSIWRTPLPDGALLEQGGLWSPLHTEDALQITLLTRIDVVTMNSTVHTAVPIHTLGSFGEPGTLLQVAYRPEGAVAWTNDEPRWLLGDARTFRWDGRRVAFLEQRRVGRVDLETGEGVRAELPYATDWDTGLAFAGNRVLIGRLVEDGLHLELVELR